MQWHRSMQDFVYGEDFCPFIEEPTGSEIRRYHHGNFFSISCVALAVENLTRRRRRKNCDASTYQSNNFGVSRKRFKPSTPGVYGPMLQKAPKPSFTFTCFSLLIVFLQICSGFFLLLLVAVRYSFVDINQVIGWEGWVMFFCFATVKRLSGKIISEMAYFVQWDVEPCSTQCSSR